MIRNLLALAGFLALTLASAMALQAYGYLDGDWDAEPPPRLAVSTDGLDLASPAGVELLEGRINTAIAQVCPDEGRTALKRYGSVRECREAAVASVRPQVDRAIAAAEERDDYADRAPAPPHRWREEPVYDAPPPAVTPPTPPLPGARLFRRTTTTTETTTTGQGGPASDERTVIRKVIVKDAPAKSTRPRAATRSAAFARRPLVAHSWLPPVAWAASDRATLRAFRTGRMTPWGLTDRDGIRRDGYVSVGAVRWTGGCRCRDVRVVKYAGRRQLVVAAGLRCVSKGRLVNRGL